MYYRITCSIMDTEAFANRHLDNFGGVDSRCPKIHSTSHRGVLWTTICQFIYPMLQCRTTCRRLLLVWKALFCSGNKFVWLLLLLVLIPYYLMGKILPAMYCRWVLLNKNSIWFTDPLIPNINSISFGAPTKASSRPLHFIIAIFMLIWGSFCLLYCG